MSTSLYSKTPSVTVLDNRGLAVRDIVYHRHPETPDTTDERIIRHQFDARGLPSQSADPRLYAAGRANFSYLPDLVRRRAEAARGARQWRGDHIFVRSGNPAPCWH